MGIPSAAAGEVDLAPPVGIFLAGYGARLDPSDGLHDPVMARAVLLDDGASRVAVVSCDLVGFTPEVDAELRSRVGREISAPPEHVIIACTHTHSGPAITMFRGPVGRVDREWPVVAHDKIVALLAELAGRMTPARFSCAFTDVAGIGYNREDPSRTPDPQLGVIGIDAEDGSAIATIINYACHPVIMGPSNLKVSGDFAGAAARRIGELRGGVGIYLQGACGDVDPKAAPEWSVPGRDRFEAVEEVGAVLAERAAESLVGAAATSQVEFRAGSRVVDVPLEDAPGEEELAEFEAAEQDKLRLGVAEKNAVKQEWAKAMLGWVGQVRSAVAAGTMPASLPARITAVGINELRLVGVPFEAFTDVGLGVKEALKPHPTIFAGYVNGLHGYLPAGWAQAQDGASPGKAMSGYAAGQAHRWWSSPRTAVARGGDELIIREAAKLAGSL